MRRGRGRRRRRFPLPRGPRPRLPRGARPRAHRALQRAHRLMESGDYANASDIFEMLAQGARDRGLLRQAPRLYLQAGKASLLGGQRARGVELLRAGLTLLAESQRWAQLHQASTRVIDELEQWGETELAEEFRQWLHTQLPEDEAAYQQRAAQAPRRPPLPLHCPSCGGPVRPDEVEWLDATTAECPYCGSGIRGE